MMASSKQERIDKERLRIGLSCAKLVSNAEIMKATKKPDGVSDIRWKMELRRRRDKAYYSQMGELP